MPRRTQTYAIRLAVERAKLDTERLERAAYLPLELLVDADKAITRAKERSQPVAGQALDVNLAEPTGARQLRQSLGIGGVRLVEPPGKSTVRLAGIDTHDRQTESSKLTGQPFESCPLSNTIRTTCLAWAPQCRRLLAGPTPRRSS
ncbi:MAG TPA: hypothetical protein VHI98_08780 [Vicinamibacterales bacterium]|nr:hypothetical protein [Vicinamibacterales bacterium]